LSVELPLVIVRASNAAAQKKRAGSVRRNPCGPPITTEKPVFKLSEDPR
jgi:hypothetical protein